MASIIHNPRVQNKQDNRNKRVANSAPNYSQQSEPAPVPTVQDLQKMEKQELTALIGETSAAKAIAGDQSQAAAPEALEEAKQ